MNTTDPRPVGASRNKFGYLLAALIALLATMPVIGEGWAWKRVLGLFAGGVLVAGLYAARPGRRSLAIGSVLAAVDVGLGSLLTIHDARWLVLLQVILWISSTAFVAASILRAVLRSVPMTLETLQGALCVYLLLGLLWAYLFALFEIALPASFESPGFAGLLWWDDGSRRSTFVRILVFSYSTMTTTGYSDLRPSNGFSAIAACLEAMMAQVFLAVVIARLVGMQSVPKPLASSDGTVDEGGCDRTAGN